MKARVCYTVQVPDSFREALAAYHGRQGKATRKEVVEYLKQNGMRGEVSHEEIMDALETV